MGRKSRSKRSVKSPLISAFTNKKEVDRLMQKLLNACVQPTTKKNEWENYMEIQFLVERIRQYQSHKNPPESDRIEKLSGFQDWLEKHHVMLNGIATENYGREFGLGVKATGDIKKDSMLTSVPYDIMMTAENASKSYLDDFVKSRKMLSEMPNVLLALYLHCEKYDPHSKFKPYIDILPTEYNTTLYFTPEEMKLLKGSGAFSKALTQYKSIARQYAIFFNLMHCNTIPPEVEKIPVVARNEFTYDAYRWAVSSVSTRQNRIATMTEEEKQAAQKEKGEEEDISDSTLALIPMWDMFNHSVGPVSTDCDPKKQHCKSYAMMDFKEGEQVTICYGPRSNVDFLVYNGFVTEKNPFDRVEVQFGVSPNDKLYSKKVKLLEKLRLKPCGSFQIYALTDNIPTSPELLAFLRVFHMSEDELDAWIAKDANGPEGLKEIYMPYTLGVEADVRMWNFLENRIKLLLHGYRSQEEEDELLQNEDVTERMKLAMLLHREAKRVLQSCHEFCKWFPDDLQKNVSEQAIVGGPMTGVEDREPENIITEAGDVEILKKNTVNDILHDLESAAVDSDSTRGRKRGTVVEDMRNGLEK